MIDRIGHVLGACALALALPLLTACGSGDASAPRSGVEDTVTIESTGALDGFVRSDGVAVQAGGGPGVGDLDGAKQGLAFRMVYSFDLAAVPADAILTAVTLRVFVDGTVGDPFGNLGALLVDHVDVGDALDVTDYAGGTLRDNLGTLAADPLRVYRNLGVASAVQADRDAGRRRSQFRLRFPVDSNFDGGNDVVLLEDGENSRRTSNPPVLVVAWVTP